VAVSAVLVAGALLALAVGALASSRERLVSFAVAGQLDGVSLDVGEASVDVMAGKQGSTVRIERLDRFTFGHAAEVHRTVEAGRLRLRSRCPATVPHSCSVAYRVVVPDNVPVDVRTGGGNVRFHDYRGSARISTDRGNITVDGFCGFLLQARTETGDVGATSSCPPPQLSLRSTSGDVRATVPPGRYQVDAASASGSLAVRNVVETADAPVSIEVLSSTGDVLVEGRR
jgi:Putative adhesin